MKCWECKLIMKKVEETFHGFSVEGWKCPKCQEIVFDEAVIQPILQYNKLQQSKQGLTVKVGVLGKSKILRIPKVAEQIYSITKGEKVTFSLEPGQITVKLKD